MKAPDDITKRSDYSGLVHVDHRHALEARFPGTGHGLASSFTTECTDKAKPAFPPPEPARRTGREGFQGKSGGCFRDSFFFGGKPGNMGIAKLLRGKQSDPVGGWSVGRVMEAGIPLILQLL